MENRKKIINNNLNLLNSKDEEIESLAIYSLFPNESIVTLEFVKKKPLVNLYIIDTESGIELFKFDYAYEANGGWDDIDDPYLEIELLQEFCEKFRLTINVEAIINSLRFEFDFDYPFEVLKNYSFNLEIDRNNSSVKITSVKIFYLREEFTEEFYIKTYGN